MLYIKIIGRTTSLKLRDQQETERRLLVPFLEKGTMGRDRAIITRVLQRWGDEVYGVSAEALACIFVDAVRNLVSKAEQPSYVQRAEVIVDALEFRGDHDQAPGDIWADSFLASVQRQLP